MMDRRGVVLEIDGNRAVVLTPRGEFLATRARTGWEVGTEVTLGPAILPAARAWYRPAAAVVAAAIVLAVFVQGMPLLPGPTVAYVTVDINPSVELAVDGRERVTSATPLNDDGRLIIEAGDLRRRSVDEAIAELVRRAARAGYMGAGQENSIIITSVPSDGPDLPPGLKQKIETGRKQANSILSAEGLRGRVETLQASPQMREEARQLGLSPGKYAIYLEARAAGLDISLENLRVNKIVKAIKDAGGVPGEIIGRAHQEKDFEGLLNRHGAGRGKDQDATDKGKDPYKDKGQEEGLGKGKDKDQDQGNGVNVPNGQTGLGDTPAGGGQDRDKPGNGNRGNDGNGSGQGHRPPGKR